MCLAIPYQIKKIKSDKADVVSMSQQRQREIDLHLLKGKVKIGDWVLALNNFAVEKVEQNDVEQLKSFYE